MTYLENLKEIVIREAQREQLDEYIMSIVYAKDIIQVKSNGEPLEDLFNYNNCIMYTLDEDGIYQIYDAYGNLLFSIDPKYGFINDYSNEELLLKDYLIEDIVKNLNILIDLETAYEII